MQSLSPWISFINSLTLFNVKNNNREIVASTNLHQQKKKEKDNNSNKGKSKFALRILFIWIPILQCVFRKVSMNIKGLSTASCFA